MSEERRAGTEVGARDGGAPFVPALRGENIICFSKDWNLDPTSNHHVLMELAKYNRVLWINSIGTRTPNLKSGRDVQTILRKLRTFGPPKRVQDDLWIFTPLVLPLPYSKAANLLNTLVLKTLVRAMRLQLGMDKFQLWTFLPNAAPYFGQLGESLAVYYCTDEWAKFSYIADQRMNDLEVVVCKAADVVFATSRSLKEKLSRMNPETHLAPHGVDHADFAAALEEKTTIPADVAGIKRPIVGYYGLVQDWLNMDLVEYMAKRHPEWSFVFVGSVMIDITRFKTFPNVHFLGRKPHSELPNYCKAFSVGLMPHHVNDLTRHMNPIKLREYLSAGLPVVSTALPEALPYSDKLTIANNFEEFERGVEAAIAETSLEKKRARSDAMKPEGWAYRVQAVATQVAKAAARKRGT